LKTIFGYLKEFTRETNKLLFFFISLFTGLLVFSNYHFGIDHWIRKKDNAFLETSLWFIVFFLAFAFPYLLSFLFGKRGYFHEKKFLFLLVFAPLLFAFKLGNGINFHFSDVPSSEIFWNYVVYWPLLLLITGTALFIYWKLNDADQPFYGLKGKNISFKPYLILLMLMVPLVAAASTQPDFLEVYPKIKTVTGIDNINAISWERKILFELSYGSDFITIELFFRGFLILAFLKFAGRDAILPMACFYCTIHFGKPLGECISSYFGGMILGVIVYHTRSIYGGLIIHLGIAWLMELGGYIGNQ
jgi:hypothetical protein